MSLFIVMCSNDYCVCVMCLYYCIILTVKTVCLTDMRLIIIHCECLVLFKHFCTVHSYLLPSLFVFSLPVAYYIHSMGILESVYCIHWGWLHRSPLCWRISVAVVQMPLDTCPICSTFHYGYLLSLPLCIRWCHGTTDTYCITFSLYPCCRATWMHSPVWYLISVIIFLSFCLSPDGRSLTTFALLMSSTVWAADDTLPLCAWWRKETQHHFPFVSTCSPTVQTLRLFPHTLLMTFFYWWNATTVLIMAACWWFRNYHSYCTLLLGDFFCICCASVAFCLLFTIVLCWVHVLWKFWFILVTCYCDSVGICSPQ